MFLSHNAFLGVEHIMCIQLRVIKIGNLQKGKGKGAHGL
jgi:hypothetical protein